jgi:hypothetical protein
MTELELTSLLFQLADLNVTGVKVKYDGSGDSGSIDWIGFTKEPCETPEDVIDRVNDWDNEYTLTNLDEDLYYQIESFAENKLLDDIEDWWNNEGGYGDLCICVPSGKYVINNHVRIIETKDYFHDGDLLSKVNEE